MRGHLALFEKTIPIFPNNPALVLHTIVETVTVLRRDGKLVDSLTDEHFVNLLTGIKNNVIAKEAVDAILEIWTHTPNLSLSQAKEKLGIEDIDMAKIDGIIDAIIQENMDLIESKGRGAMGPLMGDLMEKVGRGAIDGKTLSKKLMQALRPHFKQLKSKKGGN
jgi:glutamyl-tRNA(Gln) amidotransferase subunit E